MTFSVFAKKLISRGNEDIAAGTSSEENLRSMLTRTIISRRGIKKPDSGTTIRITSDHSDYTRQTDREASSSQLSLLRTAIPVSKSTDSYHSISSEESFANEDGKCFDWVGENLSSEEEEDAKQSVCENYDDADEDDSIVLDSIQNDEGHDNDNSNESLEQSLNSSRPQRHLERCESRRRRRLSIGRSHGSGSMLSNNDESLDNISDSLDIGSSSRHSVGRSYRRRTTHNRHLHHTHRQKQVSVSTSSDPSCECSNTSVLHRRLERNQSQRSILSSRDNPRYIVVKAGDPPTGPDDHVKDLQQIREAQRNDAPVKATCNIDHPRFIVIEAKEEGETDGKPHTRRGRRQRVHTAEKTHQTV